MKKVLFAGLLVLAGVSVSAQNLIKNEKFATEVKTCLLYTSPRPRDCS